MRIAIDVDGVLADLVGGLCKRIPGLTPEQITTFDFSKSLTSAQMEIVDKASHEYGFCASLDWYPGALQMVWRLQTFGDVYAVTAPWHAATWESERRAWLEGAIHKDKIISCPSKSKPTVCEFANVLIEDNLETARQWHTLTGSLAILIDRPWNQGVLPRGIVRCTNYLSVTSIINNEH